MYPFILIVVLHKFFIIFNVLLLVLTVSFWYIHAFFNYICIFYLIFWGPTTESYKKNPQKCPLFSFCFRRYDNEGES